MKNRKDPKTIEIKIFKIIRDHIFLGGLASMVSFTTTRSYFVKVETMFGLDVNHLKLYFFENGKKIEVFRNIFSLIFLLDF